MFLFSCNYFLRLLYLIKIQQSKNTISLFLKGGKKSHKRGGTKYQTKKARIANLSVPFIKKTNTKTYLKTSKLIAYHLPAAITEFDHYRFFIFCYFDRANWF